MTTASMPAFDPHDPEFESRVRVSFERQNLMRTFEAELVDIRPGAVEVALPFQEALTQQHGYLHAAAITAIADSACGYAALTLAEPRREVLTVEFKTNLLAPASGERFVAKAEVLRPGRRITVCRAEVVADPGTEDAPKTIAAMQATVTSTSKVE